MISSRAKITTDSFNYSEFTLGHMIEKKRNPRLLGPGVRVMEGVTSFFEGNITQSIKLLNQALIAYQTNLNIQAFLSSAYATEYFLSGEESNESLQRALTEFDNVKKLDSNYRLDSRYFSPRILELFAQESEN